MILILSGSFVVLAWRAPEAHASSFLASLFGSSVDAAGLTTGNSQNMKLLAPAVNLDPNPAKGGGDIAVVDSMALEAQIGPSGTAADINEWPTSSQVSVYIVHKGDTLSEIASMFGVSVNTVIWANDIKGGVIHEGDTLVILPITGIRHTVAKGETIQSIAKTFKSDATEIAQYNGLALDSTLSVGTSIIIPNGEIASAAPTTSSTKKTIKVGKEPFLGGSGPAVLGYYSWPLNGGVITQGLHGWNAVDIGAPKGTSIFAAAGGTVIVARSGGGWNGGYGNYVVIAHGNGTQTLYAHMNKVLVSAGDTVVQGQTIGQVGTTGESTGPHLHFEVRGAQNPFASY